MAYFENKDMYSIKENMKSGITTCETREGSLVDAIVGTMAVDLAKAYENLNSMVDGFFLINDNVPTDFLDKRAEEYGLIREDNETDSELRIRILDYIQQPRNGGSATDYVFWSEGLPGVLKASCTPLIAGPGTVGVNYIGEVSEVVLKEHIDNFKPIGADVRVTKANNLAINISLTANVQTGADLEQLKTQLGINIQEYLNDIAMRETSINYARVMVACLNTLGIKDVSELKLNDTIGNLEIALNQYPVVETIAVTVV